MSGEKNLKTLLSSMEPELKDGIFVFCTAEGESQAEGLAPVCTFREEEGLTMILNKTEAERVGIAFSYESRMITLNVHSSLVAIGFLAAITQRLAAADISVNTISAYYHDHLFVPVDRAQEAIDILRSFS